MVTLEANGVILSDPSLGFGLLVLFLIVMVGE